MSNKSKREKQLREAIELLFFSYRSFTSGPDAILEKHGLGRVHHRVLYFVGSNPNLSVNDLLGILEISKQALNAPLRQLIQMGLIKNQPSTSDRRVRQLRLTAEGRRLEARLTGTQLLQLESIFSQQGKKAEKAWRDVMLQLAEE